MFPHINGREFPRGSCRLPSRFHVKVVPRSIRRKWSVVAISLFRLSLSMNLGMLLFSLQLLFRRFFRFAFHFSRVFRGPLSRSPEEGSKAAAHVLGLRSPLRGWEV